MAIECVGSTLRLSSDPLLLRIHDDGSLTEEDVISLESAFGSIEIIRRSAADEKMADHLRSYPNLFRLRAELPVALKLIDIPLLSGSSVITCLDSDVLFWRRFRFPLPKQEDGGIFLTDRENSYSLRSWEKALSGMALPEKANSGIVIFSREHYDIAFLEWFIGRPFHRTILSMLEQTAWAAMGFRAGCRKIAPSCVRIMRNGESDDPLAGGHFTARTRPLLKQYIARSRAADMSIAPIELETIPAGECTAWDLAGYEIRRLTGRIAGDRKLSSAIPGVVKL